MSAAPDLVARIAELTRERDEARATVERVRELAETMGNLAGMRFLGEPFPPAVTLADLRATLDPPADPWCRSETCPHRHWRSGSVPTHRRGADCPPADPPADRLCDCRGGADVCPPCRARGYE